MSEQRIEDLLVMVASPPATDDSPERQAAWREIKRRERTCRMQTKLLGEMAAWLDDALLRNQVVHEIDRERAREFVARAWAVL